VPAETSELMILYRDEYLLAVAKPSGMLVHNGWAREPRVALGEAKRLVGRYVYPVHRLDRGTSGVLWFALSAEVARLMQATLVSPATEKRYLALVRGITPERGTVEHALAKRKGGEKREAVTRYQRLASFERYSLVLARPLSGRLHQIRRHMKHISHPVIGDVRYGKREHNHLMRDRFGLARLALHALSFSLLHPVGGQPLFVHAALPPDLACPLRAMGLLSSGSSGGDEHPPGFEGWVP
jgi:tRNA pseudouridine65 synthase